MGREQIEERRTFSKAEKEIILKKSRDKCCRCGKGLTTRNMTVEHIIPLSKGGTNKIENMVALCKECNEKKSNDIINPYEYYYYVEDEYMHEIIQMYSQYLQDVPWHSKHNYTMEDVHVIEYAVPLASHKSRRNGNGAWTKALRMKMFLQHVYLIHFNEVVDIVTKYNKKYGIDTSNLDETVKYVFDNGCFYRLSKNGETIALFPFYVEKVSQMLEDEDTEIPMYILRLNGIICRYEKPEYMQPIAEAIQYIMKCLGSLNHLKIARCYVTIPTDNNYLRNVIKNYLQGSYNGVSAEADVEGWLIQFVDTGDTTEANNKIAKDFKYNETINMGNDKLNLIFSDSLERSLRLPVLENKKKKKKDNKG